MKTRKIFILLLLLTILISGGFIFLYLKKPFPCRTWYGSPLETGIVGDPEGFAAEYQTILSTAACIVNIEEGIDPLFPDSSARLKIGYFDSDGKLFTYLARLGGEDFDGNRVEVGLCSRNENSIVDCKSASPTEVVQNLKEGQIVGADIVLDDGIPWEVSSQIKKYQGTLELLKRALRSGQYYPKPNLNEGFVIQIMQITF